MCILSSHSLLFIHVIFIVLSIDVRVINASEDTRDLEYPADDPSWLLPYQTNHFPSVIHDMCDHFSQSMQSQIVQEKGHRGEAGEALLRKRDLNYCRGSVLAHRLTQVMNPPLDSLE